MEGDDIKEVENTGTPKHSPNYTFVPASWMSHAHGLPSNDILSCLLVVKKRENRV